MTKPLFEKKIYGVYDDGNEGDVFKIADVKQALKDFEQIIKSYVKIKPQTVLEHLKEIFGDFEKKQEKKE